MTGLEHNLLFVKNVCESGLILEKAFLFDAFDRKELAVQVSLDEENLSVGALPELLDLLEVLDGVAFFLRGLGLRRAVVCLTGRQHLNFFD